MKKTVKIAVTGAAGQIGYSLLFRIASGQMFGPDTEIHLSLLELPQAMNALKGVVMELEDCAFSLLRSIDISDNPSKAFKNIDWALLVGSVPRKQGMERKDLLKINASVFIEQGRALSDDAKPTCRVLVVGNPCNTNAFIAKTVAKNIPPENFYALTMLDQHRAYAQIAQKAKVSVSDIKNLIIWGNHSSTQYPDFYHGTIHGRPIPEIITDEKSIKGAFLEIVQKRGAAIIQARGLSSAASAANAVVDAVWKIITPTPSGESFSLAVVSDGSYGVEEGLVFSFPIRSDGFQVSIVQGLKHSSFSDEKIKKTLEELKEEQEAVRFLLLEFCQKRK